MTKSPARRIRFIDPFQPAEIRRLVKEFGSPLLILDCERVRVQYRKLRKALPGVDLHYALKPMPHPSVVNTIVEEGGYLDLATTGEVHLVERLGVEAGALHPYPSHQARSRTSSTPSNSACARLLLTTLTRCRSSRGTRRMRSCCCGCRSDRPERYATSRASSGAIPRICWRLRDVAADLGVSVRGLSFHVGSQAMDSAKHVEALEACTKLMAAARREKLGTFDTLDIGGGFPIDYAQPVEDISRFCAPLRAALAKLPKRVRVIAEPGRYIVGPSALGVASVMGEHGARGIGGITSTTDSTDPIAASFSIMRAIRSRRCGTAMSGCRRCWPDPLATVSM